MESSCAPFQAPSEEASELARLREIAALREIEMDEARQIQALLRPTGPLRGPNFEIACSSVPFSEVSGDFADYFELPNGMVGIYLGDVAGKGLPAAMYGALAMGTLRGTDKTGKSTNGVLEMLNTRLRARPSSGRFCATIYALLNPATLELQFSNAGLPYPLHSSDLACKLVGEGGVPSGLLQGSSYGVHSIKLSPGDSVLFATDGLHELQNSREEEFGVKLAAVWQDCRAKSAEDTIRRLFDFLNKFASLAQRRDDLTVVVLKALRTMVLSKPAQGFARVAL